MNGNGITSSINIRIAGLHIIIHMNRTIRIHLNLSDQQFGHRTKTDTDHRQIGLNFALICLNEDMLFITVKMSGNRVGLELNTMLRQHSGNFPAEWQVNIVAQQRRHAIYQNDLFVVAAICLRQFNADIPSANNSNFAGIFGTLFDLASIIITFAHQDARNTDTGNRRDHRITARRHNELVVLIMLLLAGRQILGHDPMISRINR